MTITDLYINLFGKSHIKDGDVISMSEHGRVGGVSTGQPFKFTSDIDPDTGVSTSQSVLLLRRIVQLLQPLATQDVNNRQKVVIDGITNGVAGIGVLVPGADSGAGNPSTNWPTRLAPIQQPTTLPWLPVWIGPVDQRFQIIDAARLTYDQGIRSHLTFT